MPQATIPILTPADQEHLSHLKRAVQVAQRNAKQNSGVPLRGGDADPNEELEAAKAAYNEYLDEAEERAEKWVLETIGHEEYRELLKDHPPRKVTEQADDGTVTEVDHPDDKDWGVNTETFPKKLLLYVDEEDAEIRTIADLKDDDGNNIAADLAKIQRRVKRLSMGQFETLWVNAVTLNGVGVTDPKSDRFSTVTPRSTET